MGSRRGYQVMSVDAVPEEHVYTTEVVTTTVDPDDSFNYTSVPVTQVAEPALKAGSWDDRSPSIVTPATESLQDTLQQVKVSEVQGTATSIVEPTGCIDRPELVQDFIRNYLLKKGMEKSFHAFQTEWYDMAQSQRLKVDPEEAVPDCYVENLRLEAEIERLRREVKRRVAETSKMAAMAATLKKERDFHRISHRRVKEEMREHSAASTRADEKCEEMREALDTMREKYQKVLRQKTNASLSLERSQKEVDEMVELSKQVLDLSMDGTTFGATKRRGQGNSSAASLPAPQLPQSATSVLAETSMPPTPQIKQRALTISSASRDFAASALERKAPRLVKTFRAHDDGVCALAIDATGGTYATASDDSTFRTWQPDGELLLEGTKHSAWVSSCTFHPGGNSVAATASGDTTVKLWDLEQARCSATLSGHAFAVWDVNFHCSGDFLASSSLDNTVKLWDVATGQCRRTLRGHSDAANSVEFQPESNVAVSSGADRSCLVWDARLGRATAGLKGHQSAVFHASFSPDGSQVASVDASGTLMVWEMRTATCLAKVKVASRGGVNEAKNRDKRRGSSPANRCIFDPTGALVAVGSEDSVIRLFNAADPGAGPLCEMAAHTDAVQGLAFNRTNGSLISGSADGTVRTWVYD